MTKNIFESKLDYNWDKLFTKYNIEEHIEKYGFFEITSKQINEYRESRLMTKFDHRVNLPKAFKKNKLSILPLTRGSYIIGKFDAYKDLGYDDQIEITSVEFPLNIESIDPTNIYSESAALHCAYITGIISDVVEESVLPTLSGRMSSSIFNFSIKSHKKDNAYNIVVENSQCEIDGGYEGESKLAIIEAKNFTVDDFLIRQLYYPYRLWSKKTSKEVVPIFMTYSNDIFSFFIYRFDNIEEYNSLTLVKQKNYIIGQENIRLEDLIEILEQVEIVDEPKIPFPQADKFERVVDLLGLLMESELTKEEITLNYDFTERQTDYYTNAARYLSLIDKKMDKQKGVVFCINEKGAKIMSKRYKNKYLSLAECILKHEVFNKVFRRTLSNYSLISREDTTIIMEECELYNVNSEDTIDRRAQTVLKWVEWILELQNNF